MANAQYTTAYCRRCQTVSAVVSKGRCSECVHRHYLAHRDRMLSVIKRRRHLPEVKARDAERNRGPKCKARKAVRAAIISGSIVRPAQCSKCGVQCVPQGHHDDYSQPLNVSWLCQSCHSRRHRELREQEPK